MKKRTVLLKDYEKTTNRIKANEAKINDLTLMYERREALQAGDRAKYDELHARYKENEAEIIKLSEAVYIDKIVLQLINESIKAAAVAEVFPVIKEVFTKYDGKPCGEKTREKIRAEIKEKTGFYIGLSGYLKTDTLTIYSVSKIYPDDAQIHAKYERPFITAENKIDAGALDEATPRNYTYSENPTADAKKLVKLYNKARAAYEAAEKALNDYNAAAPQNLYKTQHINTLYRTIL